VPDCYEWILKLLKSVSNIWKHDSHTRRTNHSFSNRWELQRKLRSIRCLQRLSLYWRGWGILWGLYTNSVRNLDYVKYEILYRKSLMSFFPSTRHSHSVLSNRMSNAFNYVNWAIISAFIIDVVLRKAIYMINMPFEFSFTILALLWLFWTKIIEAKISIYKYNLKINIIIFFLSSLALFVPTIGKKFLSIIWYEHK